MHSPPDAEMRRARLEQADPKSQYPISQFSNIDTYTSPLDLQAAKLVGLYCLAECTARAVAHLVWGRP